MPSVCHLTDSSSRLAGGMFESIPGLTNAIESTTSWNNSILSLADEFSIEDSHQWSVSIKNLPSESLGPLRRSLELRHAIAASESDAFHLHGIWGASSREFSYQLKANTSTRFIVSPRGMLDPWALQHHGLRKKLAWWKWDRNVLRNAACIHALCRSEAESILKLGLNRPVCVIPNGIATPVTVDPAERTKPDQIVFVSRLHEKKGILELIEAWQNAGKDLPETARLVIAGWGAPGFVASVIKKIESLESRNSIRFVGSVYGEKKDKLLRQSGGFILPSRSEGLPMAVLEAWNYSLPAIITPECNLPEASEGNAAMITSCNTDSIKRTLIEFFQTPVRERIDLGNKGKRIAIEKFSWNRIAESMAQVYSWVTDSGPRPDCFIG